MMVWREEARDEVFLMVGHQECYVTIQQLLVY